MLNDMFGTGQRWDREGSRANLPLSTDTSATCPHYDSWTWSSHSRLCKQQQAAWKPHEIGADA